jgi:hypothetical protein
LPPRAFEQDPPTGSRSDRRVDPLDCDHDEPRNDPSSGEHTIVPKHGKGQSGARQVVPPFGSPAS